MVQEWGDAVDMAGEMHGEEDMMGKPKACSVKQSMAQGKPMRGITAKTTH